MIAAGLITFRETLEAALIIGIILGYLAKTKQQKYNNVIYIGVGAGIVASIIGAMIFSAAAGGFTGRTEEIFEGITMIIGAALLTTMIFWMLQQKNIARHIEQKAEQNINSAKKAGLFLLAFTSVFREGIETVIFLGAASFASEQNSMAGAVLGIIVAIALGYAIYVGSMKINIKKLFTGTSIMLILFAAGLVAHGVHEFEEAGILHPIISQVWDINPATNADGSFPALHEKGSIGGILKSLFGYNGNPSLLEVLSYATYIIIAILLWKKIDSLHKSRKKPHDNAISE